MREIIASLAKLLRVRLSEAERAELLKVAREQGITLSGAVRRCIVEARRLHADAGGGTDGRFDL